MTEAQYDLMTYALAELEGLVELAYPDGDVKERQPSAVQTMKELRAEIKKYKRTQRRGDKSMTEANNIMSRPIFWLDGIDIIEGVMSDRSDLVEETTTPRGVGPVYFIEATDSGYDIYRWYAGGARRTVMSFDTEEEAQAQLDEWAAHDIMNNANETIYLSRADAEETVVMILEQQADEEIKV